MAALADGNFAKTEHAVSIVFNCILCAMQHTSKTVQTPLPLLDAIKQRWSPVAFSGKPIEQEKIMTIFEAARWAPSSFNEQPWRYIYATKDDQEGRRALESLLSEGNSWAKNAYLLLISFAKKTFVKNGKENRHAMHDVGCATGYIALQLPTLGLAGHQMAGFAFEKANGILGVPDDFIPGSMMAVGYPGDIEELPPDLQARQESPRTRRDAGDFAFRGKWMG